MYVWFSLPHFVLQWWKLIHSKSWPGAPRTKCYTLLVHSVRFLVPILPLSFILFMFWGSILGTSKSLYGLYKFGTHHLLTYRTKYTMNKENQPLRPLREAISSLKCNFILTTTPSYPSFYISSTCFLFSLFSSLFCFLLFSLFSFFLLFFGSLAFFFLLLCFKSCFPF